MSGAQRGASLLSRAGPAEQPMKRGVLEGACPGGLDCLPARPSTLPLPVSAPPTQELTYGQVFFVTHVYLLKANSCFKTLVSASPDSRECHKLFLLTIPIFQREVLGTSSGLQDIPNSHTGRAAGRQVPSNRNACFWGYLKICQGVLRHR